MLLTSGGAIASIMLLSALALAGCMPTASLPLHIAAQKGDLATIGELLDSGTDVNQTDGSGNTAIAFAVRYDGTSNPEGVALRTVKFLVTRGANVNGADEYGCSALWLCAEGMTRRGRFIPLDSVARFLIEKGADVNKVNDFSAAPLHAAAQNGNPAVAALLIQHGADVNLVCKNGETPLMVAAIGGNAEDGSAELRISAERRLSVARILIAHGANVNLVQHGFVGWRATALDWATIRGESAMCDLLRRNGGIRIRSDAGAQ